MAFITGTDLVALLPANTALTSAEAQRFIDAAVMRLAESHDPAALPENAVTRELVEEMAYAKALKRHYIKGEAEIDTEPLDDEIERVEKRFDAYDARYTTPGEQALEAPIAYIGEAPF